MAPGRDLGAVHINELRDACQEVGTMGALSVRLGRGRSFCTLINMGPTSKDGLKKGNHRIIYGNTGQIS